MSDAESGTKDVGEVVPLRPAATERPEHYTAMALQTFGQIGAKLFQLRKIGITVHVPDAIRQQMLAEDGQAAAQLLALIDGRITGML